MGAGSPKALKLKMHQALPRRLMKPYTLIPEPWVPMGARSLPGKLSAGGHGLALLSVPLGSSQVLVIGVYLLFKSVGYRVYSLVTGCAPKLLTRRALLLRAVKAPTTRCAHAQAEPQAGRLSQLPGLRVQGTRARPTPDLRKPYTAALAAAVVTAAAEERLRNRRRAVVVRAPHVQHAESAVLLLRPRRLRRGTSRFEIR